MNCEEYGKQICAYMDNELDPKAKEVLEAHLNVCPRCRTSLNVCLHIRSIIRRKALSTSAPEELRKNIINALQEIENYRESGIPSIDLVKWGTHIAQIYKDKEDLFDVIIPYVISGLEQDERCIWIISNMKESDVNSRLSRQIKGLSHYVDSGQLCIIDHESWYLSNGTFKANHVIENTLGKCMEAICSGFTGLRLVGTTEWLSPEKWDELIKFEECLSQNISSSKQIVLCTYKYSKHVERNIMDVQRTHNYVLLKTDGVWRSLKTSSR